MRLPVAVLAEKKSEEAFTCTGVTNKVPHWPVRSPVSEALVESTLSGVVQGTKKQQL